MPCNCTLPGGCQRAGCRVATCSHSLLFSLTSSLFINCPVPNRLPPVQRDALIMQLCCSACRPRSPPPGRLANQIEEVPAKMQHVLYMLVPGFKQSPLNEVAYKMMIQDPVTAFLYLVCSAEASAPTSASREKQSIGQGLQPSAFTCWNKELISNTKPRKTATQGSF